MDLDKHAVTAAPPAAPSGQRLLDDARAIVAAAFALAMGAKSDEEGAFERFVALMGDANSRILVAVGGRSQEPDP